MAKTLEERIAELEGLEVGTRVKALEVITKRQARKKQEKISGIIFPFPICGCGVPDENGIIFRAMLPCDGTLVKALVDVEGIVSAGGSVGVQAEIKIDSDVYVRDFNISSHMQEYELELPVLMGSKLSVKTTSPDVQGLIWASLLFIPQVSEAAVKKILMEDLKDAEENGTKAPTTSPEEGP